MQDVPHIQGGEHVQRAELRDHIRMIQPRSDGNQCATIVADEGKLLVSQFPGHLDDVGSHCSFGVGVRVFLDRFVAGSVSAEIRADDGVIRRQGSGYVTPHEVSLREAVQKDEWCSASADRDVEPHSVCCGNLLVVEAWNGDSHRSLSLVGVMAGRGDGNQLRRSR